MRAKLNLDLKGQFPAVVQSAIDKILAGPKLKPNQIHEDPIGESGVWIRYEQENFSLSVNNSVDIAFGFLPLGLTSGNISSVEIYDEGATEFPVMGKYNIDSMRAIVGQSSNDKLPKWYIIVTAQSLTMAIHLYDLVLGHKITPVVYHQQHFGEAEIA